MKWAIKSLLSEGEVITMWKVLRRIGIGVNISKGIKENVINSINEFIRVHP